MAFGRRLGSGKKTLGHYELVTELFPGYLGPVWGGRADAGPHQGAVVLARRILQTSTSQSGGDHAQAADSLAAAAEFASSLEHPNVQTVLGVERDDTELAILCAYREGEPLRSLLRLAGVQRSPVPSAVVVRIAHDILAGLTYLHEQRYEGAPLLASLNPDHVYVGSDGCTQIGEPAVAMVASATEPWLRNVKRAAYDAPEKLATSLSHSSGQSSGQSSDPVESNADIFSLGVLMWELLRNRPLFAGASFDAVAKRVSSAAIRRVDALKPAGGDAVAPSVAAIVERALQRNPLERYARTSEMSGALESETMASHEEVAALLSELGSDVLAKQRRKVAQVGGEVRAVVKAAVASATSAEADKAPAATVSDPEAIASSTVIAVGDIDDEAAVEALVNRNDMPTIPVPGHKPSKPETGLSEKRTLMGMTSPSEPAGAVLDPLTGDPFDLDSARDASVASEAVPADAAPGAADSRPSAPQAPVDSRSSGKGYDMFSIADDPSMEEQLPPEATAALERARVDKDARERSAQKVGPQFKMMLGVAVGVALLLALLAAFVMGGDESDAPNTAPTATATAASSASAPTTAESSAAAAPAASAGAEAADEPSPDEKGASADSAEAAPKAPTKWRPSAQPRRPRPQPKKYTPGGI